MAISPIFKFNPILQTPPPPNIKQPNRTLHNFFIQSLQMICNKIYIFTKNK
jgi:hypothetical protein